MIQSLLVKLGMLAMTMGVVFWIAWRAPQSSLPYGVPLPSGVAEGVPVAGDQASTPLKAKADQEKATIESPVSGAASKTGPPEYRHGKRPLDLNRASAEDLETLPGVGAVLAQRMIEYRKSAGGYQSIDDLRHVKGIGAKKLDRMRPLVMVATPVTRGKTEKRAL